MNLKLYLQFVKQSLQEFFIYKTTALITATVGLVFFSIEIIAGIIYFEEIDLLLGWSKTDYFLLVTSANLINYIYQFIFISAHEHLSEAIIEGELDYSLVRPMNSFYYYIFFRIDVGSIINLIVVSIFDLYLISKYPINLLHLLMYVLSIIIGVFTLFLLNQIAVSFSFWFERVESVQGIPEELFDFSTRPMSIYPSSIRFLLSWIIPLLLVVNTPVLVIQGEVNYLYFIFIGVFDIVLFKLVKIMWEKGLQHYCSAN
ncbi:ABC transporter permease [Ignavigranum ruoffiae]|uniref:ABC transporter permease n=1 Tax=Ignavigranum ruoffiae TaxID=89093 RepID=UPI0024ACD44A|nr:ABC-2 family transporter protein [Ignavigranum ruoffiae]